MLLLAALEVLPRSSICFDMTKMMCQNIRERRAPVSLQVFKMAGKSPSLRRIKADIRELCIDPSDRYVAAPLEDDMFEW